MFVRVQDPSTGYQFDVSEFDPRIGDVLEVVDGHPKSRLPRPGKPRVNKAGEPAPTQKKAASSVAATPTEPAVPTKKE